MEELKPLGKTISEAITFIYIYGAILASVVIALTALIIVYTNKKKKPKNENDENIQADNDKKKYLPMKISIYVAAGVLILLVSPMIIIHLL